MEADFFFFKCFTFENLNFRKKIKMFLHLRMAAEFPPEFTAIPLEDIDPYYQNKKVRNRNFKLNDTSSGRIL